MEMKTTKNFTPKTPTTRRICVGPGQKGMMQKFIKTRAKSLTDANNNIDDKSSPITAEALILEKGSPILSTNDRKLNYHVSIYSPKPAEIPGNDLPTIERDEFGRPIRRGYTPAREKIQRELNDFRYRESELRRSRRSSSISSQPDIISSTKSEASQTEELVDDMSNLFRPSEFSGSVDSVFSDYSELTSMNSSFHYYQLHQLPQRRSLPGNFEILSENNEPLSSRKLIEKWENIIRANAKK